MITALLNASLTKQPAHLAGFVSELAVLEAHPRIEMHVHVTQALKTRLQPPPLPSEVKEEPSDLPLVTSTTLTPSPTSTPENEKPEFEVKDALLPPYVEHGRPDFLSVIGKVADESTVDDRVLAAACGPAGLVDGVREAVKGITRESGPGLDLHVEAFG